MTTATPTKTPKARRKLSALNKTNGTATFPPSTAEFVEANDSRLQRREWLRERLGEQAMLYERVAAVDAEIADLDLRLAAAADEHQNTTEPIQLELAKLEAKAIERIKDREDSDPNEDKRRAELRNEVERANTRLREETKRIEANRPQLLNQRQELTYQAAKMPSESELSNRQHASPVLLRQQFVAGQKLRSLIARREAAQTYLRRAEQAGFAFVQNGTVDDWQAELESVIAEIEVAEAEAKKLRQQIIEE